MPIRVAVIGAGYLGRHHARIYAGMEGVELVAVVDANMQVASEIASQHGGAAMADFRDALPMVDAVSIVTPTVTHRDIAVACLRAGKDVLVEKPIAATVAEADEIVAAAGDRIVQVGHLERYNPAVVALWALVKDPVFIESERISPFQGRGIDVDITLDLMIHDVEIVQGMIGKHTPKSIRAVGAKVLTDKYDAVKAWVEFEGGVTALMTASRLSDHKSRKLLVHQRDGHIALDYIEKQLVRHRSGQQGMETEVFPIDDREPLREELADFIDCVRTRKTPRVTARDGRDALETTMLITNAIQDGR